MRMKERLSATTGETMVETLISVLISSLALLMLATAIGTSVNIVMSSRDRMEEFYKGESEMMERAAAATTSSDTVDVTFGVALSAPGGTPSTTESNIPVYKSSDDNSGVAIYERSTP